MMCYTERAVDKRPKIWLNKKDKTTERENDYEVQ